MANVYRMKNKPSPFNPTIGSDMVRWYIKAVLSQGITRNNKGIHDHRPNWRNVDGGCDYTYNGKITDLQNYCARTYMDHFQSENMVKIAETVGQMCSEYGLTLRQCDIDILDDILQTFRGKPNNISIPKQEKWNLAMILLDIIDRIYNQQGAK